MSFCGFLQHLTFVRGQPGAVAAEMPIAGPGPLKALSALPQGMVRVRLEDL